ncbi:MAG: carboxypeptidase-like regulatory domain-containing protein [Gemmataceae bacterium]
MLRQTSLVVMLVLINLMFLAPGEAWGHGMGAEARLKDGQIHIEGYFDDDTPAAEARIWVEDAEKKRIAEGRADARGRWSFPAPAPGRYRVTLDAGGGHQTTISITVPASTADGAPTPDGTTERPVRVSEGASREEFTRLPWKSLAAGLVLIGLAAWLLPRLLRRAPEKASGPGEHAP